MSTTGIVALIAVGLSAGLAMAAGSGRAGDAPIRTLIITGHNNHNWQYTSRLHKDTLEATGKFAVDITDDPATTLADAKSLGGYQLFVLDYNDSQAPKRWGDAAETNFVSAVNAGIGVVSIHSANNAFKGWADYEKMIGLLWRDGAGHGAFHDFTVNILDKEHPITRGLSDIQTTDELYHKLSNPQNAKYKLLAHAFDAKETKGSGQNEPMAMTLDFGKGRIFATPLGHVWNNESNTKVSIINPGFRALLTRGAEWAATGNVTLPAEWRDVRQHNTLSDAEKTQGWVLLFDGKTPTGLRGFKKDAFPKAGWYVTDGTIQHEAGEGGGDIVTNSEYGDFDFQCEWKVAPGGNSGVMYRCDEKHNYPWETGREMQILDDDRHADGKKPQRRSGTMYDIFATSADVARPAGEWNHARIVAKGNHIEHWLNGIKVVDTDTDSEEYKKAHAASKFPSMKDFGTTTRGVIALQDHGDDVWFRNIKVRELK